VTSTPVSNLSNCRLIRTYRGPSAEYNFTIIEAIQAATALPGWFPPVKAGPAHSKESLAAGANGYNNPTKQALEEAKRVFGPDHKASIILSFGSGHRHPQCLHNGVKDGFQDVLDDLAHSGDQTAEELSQRFESSTFYNRFSVDSGLEKVSITGWTEDELGTITSHTKVYTQKVSRSIFTVAELLMKNEGCVTLGQLSKSFETASQ
jgi:predicted acylesterase/phospholipase RssA